MKRILLAASFAALLLSSSVALAGGKGNGHGGHDGHPPGKHKGWHKNYRKGEKIEVVYLEPRYYVDYHDHHLSAPPRAIAGCAIRTAATSWSRWPPASSPTSCCTTEPQAV